MLLPLMNDCHTSDDIWCPAKDFYISIFVVLARSPGLLCNILYGISIISDV